MTRLTLRKGFSLQPAPGGGGQLTDSRTGDSLVVPAADYEALASMVDGLDPGVEVLERYGPFFVAVQEGRERKDSEPGFYELDIEDAPTAVNLPSPVPSIAPVEKRESADLSRAPTLNNVSTAQLELEVALARAREAATKEHAPVEVERPETRSGGGASEVELGDDAPEVTVPAGGQFAPTEQEANLLRALDSHPTEQVSRAQMEAIISPLEDPPESAPLVPPPSRIDGRPNRRPMLLTLGGVTLLAVGVAASFALRPGGEANPPPDPQPPVAVVVDAARPKPVVSPVDAGADAIDAGHEETVDAGARVIGSDPIDAGRPVAADEPDAGATEDVTAWLSANVQGRGRVKMAEVVAGAEGEVSWTVAEGQRVKSKQALGTVGSQPLTASAVGLAMLKQPTGAVVKRGALLAEIIYFEAWAKGLVRGAVPTTAWRCKVISEAAQQKADCKVSVVTPKAGGALVMVAIEPRWFDGAADAVLRLAPP